MTEHDVERGTWNVERAGRKTSALSYVNVSPG